MPGILMRCGILPEERESEDRAGMKKKGGAEGLMKQIRNKLQSERGASITFALLLFLVCAVTGSLILMASTAASGRISRTAELDGQYYSVMSAARLLQEEIEKNPVTVTEITVTKTVTKYTNGTPETPAQAGEPQYTRQIGEQNSNTFLPASLTEDAAQRLTDGSSEGNAAIWPFIRTLTLSASEESSENLDVLKATVTETLSQDGILKLRITAGDTQSVSSGHYAVLLTFSPEKTVQTDTQAVTDTPTDTNATSYSITTTTTTTVTNTFKWTLSEMRTLTGADTE